jgi:hypothetical protein
VYVNQGSFVGSSFPMTGRGDGPGGKGRSDERCQIFLLKNLNSKMIKAKRARELR